MLFPFETGLTVSLSWSPDGEWLAFSAQGAKDEPAPVARVSLATLEQQAVTAPPRGSFGDLYPQYSPDGRQLAFFRLDGLGRADLWVQPLDGHEARRITHAEYFLCNALAWSLDAEEIFYDCGRIRRVRLAGGEPLPVAGVGEGAHAPTVRGGRMVYAQVTGQSIDIWRIPGREISQDSRTPERLIASGQTDLNADYSPDGQRIAFVSQRSGTREIWVCEDDGTEPVQLTHLDKEAGTPRWSPDGQKIVFDAEGTDVNLYVIDSEGGVARQLTHEPSADHTGTWSRDGRWIYFGSDRSGTKQIWKIPSKGGPAVQVTRGGGFYALESRDRRHLYYTKEAPSGIWRVPAGGGEEIEVLPEPIRYFWDWALSPNGIYFATTKQAALSAELAVQFLDFQSAEVTEVFKKDGPFGYVALAVSPDEEWILFGERPFPQSDLMLVENLR